MCDSRRRGVRLGFVLAFWLWLERLLELSLATRGAEPDTYVLHDLQHDYLRAREPDGEACDLARGAVRLSAHVLARAPEQFAAQLTGRLVGHAEREPVARLLTGLRKRAPRPGLLPTQPTLTPAGGALFRTLEGHSSSVNAVAITPDGRQAVSASSDQPSKSGTSTPAVFVRFCGGGAGVVLRGGAGRGGGGGGGFDGACAFPRATEVTRRERRPRKDRNQ